jgi:hypothetical protein
VCEDGYRVANEGEECTECPTHSAAVGGSVGFTLLLAFACSVVLYVVWRSEAVMIPKDSPYQTVRAFSAEDRVPPNYTYNLKLLVAYFQIATALMGYVEIPWPSDFKQFIQYFNFFNLDLIPWGSVECVATISFFDKLLIIITVPVAAMILLAVIPSVILSLRDKFDFSDSPERRLLHKLERHKLIKILVFAL